MDSISVGSYFKLGLSLFQGKARHTLQNKLVKVKIGNHPSMNKITNPLSRELEGQIQPDWPS